MILCLSINIHVVWTFFNFRPIIWKRNWNLKKVFHLFVDLVKRIHCNLINIHASLFFWKKSAFGQKFENEFEIFKKAISSFIELIKTNPLMYYIKYLGQKWSPAIRSKIVEQTDGQADRRNRFRNVLSKIFQVIYDMPTKAEN